MKEWIPRQGDHYKWSENAVRRKGTLITGVVISYDPVKKIVRGRSPNGSTERKHINEIELLSRLAEGITEGEE